MNNVKKLIVTAIPKSNNCTLTKTQNSANEKL